MSLNSITQNKIGVTIPQGFSHQKNLVSQSDSVVLIFNFLIHFLLLVYVKSMNYTVMGSVVLISFEFKLKRLLPKPIPMIEN